MGCWAEILGKWLKGWMDLLLAVLGQLPSMFRPHPMPPWSPSACLSPGLSMICPGSSLPGSEMVPLSAGMLFLQETSGGHGIFGSQGGLGGQGQGNPGGLGTPWVHGYPGNSAGSFGINPQGAPWGQGGNGGPPNFGTNTQVKSPPDLLPATSLPPSSHAPRASLVPLDPTLSLTLSAGSCGPAWLRCSESQQPE